MGRTGYWWELELGGVGWALGAVGVISGGGSLFLETVIYKKRSGVVVARYLQVCVALRSSGV